MQRELSANDDQWKETLLSKANIVSRLASNNNQCKVEFLLLANNEKFVFILMCEVIASVNTRIYGFIFWIE